MVPVRPALAIAAQPAPYGYGKSSRVPARAASGAAAALARSLELDWLFLDTAALCGPAARPLPSSNRLLPCLRMPESPWE